jgi:hypothetical protein
MDFEPGPGPAADIDNYANYFPEGAADFDNYANYFPEGAADINNNAYYFPEGDAPLMDSEPGPGPADRSADGPTADTGNSYPSLPTWIASQ